MICTSHQISRWKSSRRGLEFSHEVLREKFVKKYIDKKTFTDPGLGGIKYYSER